MPRALLGNGSANKPQQQGKRVFRVVCTKQQ
jgi:hypothetical protein